MSKFIPSKEHLRTAVIFYVHLEKTAVASYQLLQETNGDNIPSQGTWEQWFWYFKQNWLFCCCKQGTWKITKKIL